MALPRFLDWSMIRATRLRIGRRRIDGRMARGALGRRTSGIHDVAEIRQAAGMHILVLMRIFIRIRMLDHPADRLRFLHDPRAIAFFQVVGDLHARSSWCASFWAEYNLGVRLIAI